MTDTLGRYRRNPPFCMRPLPDPPNLDCAARIFAEWALPGDVAWEDLNEAAKEQARLVTRHMLAELEV